MSRGTRNSGVDNSDRRSGARALVECLERSGVELVFGYPGGNVLSIFQELPAAKFRFVLARHEQGCVHMADGYARASGKVGVVLVTSGPGLTNTITGLGCANMDGVPLVLICGQVPLSDIGTDAFQEADTTGLTRSVSKHNFLVKSADEIPETVAAAFYIATHGKPGPVVIDVPRDVQEALTAAKYPERVSLRAYHPECSALPSAVAQLAKRINAAKRPVIYAGGGVIAADAAGDVRALAHKASIPVVTTLSGIGAIDSADDFALGMGGIHGVPAAVQALKEADFILALGVRFNDRATGPLAERGSRAKTLISPRAFLVHVDCDPAAIGKNVAVDLGINADIKDLLTTVASRIQSRDHREWLTALSAHRELPAYDGGGEGCMPQQIVDTLAETTGGRCVLVTDVGQHQMFAARRFPHSRPRHFITSAGMGAMGFGIPAAIGAAFAVGPSEPIVAILGDGGAQMTAEELIVAVEHKLPIVFVVFKNQTLGLVRQMCPGGAFATELKSPDFVMLAKASGMKAFRIAKPADLAAGFKRALASRVPILVEVAVNPNANV